ncbi:MAG: DUF2231 domain-containing protein [Aquificae bacterium]|nr:DUF2231 domain-containing protein [Aquificota bacterium]
MEFLAQLHPPVVHFAIALVMMGVLFDLAGFVLKKNSLKNAGMWSIVVGALAMWVAGITGHQAEELIEHAIEGTKAYEVLEKHEELGEKLPWLATGLAVLRVYLNFRNNHLLFLGYILAGILVSGLVGLQGRIGGKLVYKYGVGVEKCMKDLPKVHREEDED